MASCLPVVRFMRDRLPELSSGGVILWQLRRSPEHGAWCYVSEFCGELTLVTHDTLSGRVPQAEGCVDTIQLMTRSEALRRRLLTAGWQEVSRNGVDHAG